MNYQTRDKRMRLQKQKYRLHQNRLRTCLPPEVEEFEGLGSGECFCEVVEDVDGALAARFDEECKHLVGKFVVGNDEIC